MKLKYFLGLIVLVLVAYAAWAFMGSTDEISNLQNNSGSSSNSTPNNNPNSNQDVVVEEVPNAIKGELQRSNDSRRGNLMLLLDEEDRIIYLNTSRDYSDLIGKHVQVNIEGSLDDFRLVDIIAD
jgi:hypothetical protein